MPSKGQRKSKFNGVVVYKNLIGAKSGWLTVIDISPTKKQKTYWICKCKCGNLKIFRYDQISMKTAKSCGCMYHLHGHSKTPEYKIWSGMRDRCNSDNPNYGGRGISICKRWNKFPNFLYDMGAKPSKNYSIDRINNNKGYSKGNCRWADRKTQARNSRNCRIISINGIKYRGVAEASESLGMPYTKIYHRAISNNFPAYKFISPSRSERLKNV